MSSLFQNLDFNLDFTLSQQKQIVRETFVFLTIHFPRQKPRSKEFSQHFTRAFHCIRSMTIYRGKLETRTNSLSPSKIRGPKPHRNEIKKYLATIANRISPHFLFTFITTCVAYIFFKWSLVAGQNFSLVKLIN